MEDNCSGFNGRKHACKFKGKFVDENGKSWCRHHYKPLPTLIDNPIFVDALDVPVDKSHTVNVPTVSILNPVPVLFEIRDFTEEKKPEKIKKEKKMIPKSTIIQETPDNDNTGPKSSIPS